MKTDPELYDGNVTKWLCTQCGHTYDDQYTAERCHPCFPIRVSGPIPKMKTVRCEIKNEESKGFHYINEYKNLRDVPLRAKIWAEWEVPEDGNY